MPRIIFVNPPRDPIAAADTQVGSVATITWEIARRLARRHTTIVFAPRRRGEPSQETGPDSVRIRRTWFAFDVLHNAWDLGAAAAGASIPHFASPSFFREYAFAAAHTLVREEPNIVHVHSCAQFLPAFRAALPGVQLNLHVHDESLARLPADRVEQQLKHADHVIASSTWLAERLRAHVPRLSERIKTMAAGADVRRFRSDDQSEEPDFEPDDAFRILYVGRIAPEKGLHVLADAFNEVVEHNDRAILEIAGAERLEPFSRVRLMREDQLLRSLRTYDADTFTERVRQQVLHSSAAYRDAIERQLSVRARARVRFLGTVPHQELAALYRRAAVFVLPSLCQEPFALSLTEAMASGLPSIVTRVGALPEIVEAGVTSLLVERGDARALARAIRRLSTNANMWRSMSCAARSRAEHLFDWKHAVDGLESLYIRLLEPRAARTPRGVHSRVRQA